MAVTYTINQKSLMDDRRKMVLATIAYSAEAYSSGVPVAKASLGLPNSIDFLAIVDAVTDIASTNFWKWDSAAEKLRGFVESAGTYAETSGNQTKTFKVMAIGY